MVGPESALWQRIHEFTLDDVDAKLTFTGRLARENGWTESFSWRVVEEYKRFVFLAMVAGREVTPSDEVDQAWHLHLVYTRSYWDELCGKVLGRPLHHGPTRGGQAEGERYSGNYQRTLASYESWFGERPPADIWPPAEIRFDTGAEHIRVNTARNWIVNKRFIARTAATVGIVGLGLAGLGAAGPLAVNGSDGPLAVFLVVLVVLIVLIVIVSFIKRNNRPGSGSGCGGFWGCTSSSCGTGGGGDDGGSGCSGSGCGGGGCGGGGCGGGD